MTTNSSTHSSLSSLFLYESGPEDAPAILFLHGAGLSGRMWQPQIDRLHDFYCLVPDLPGHGQSAEVGAWSVEQTSRYLADLIAEKAPEGRAHVVGLSYGGVVAQALLGQFPERCGGVLLSGTSPRMDRVMLAVLKISLALNRPLMKHLSPTLTSRLMEMQFGLPPEFRAMLGEDIKRFKIETLARVILAYAELPAPETLSGWVLVTVGEKETPFARVAARKLARSISGARGALVPRLGHVWNLQNPDLFDRTLRAWVNSEPLPEELRPL